MIEKHFSIFQSKLIKIRIEWHNINIFPKLKFSSINITFLTKNKLFSQV